MPCKPSVEQAVDEVQRLTGGSGADVVIDTVGGAGTLRAGIDMLRPGGRFVSFSLNHEAFSGLSAFGLYFKEVSIIGARALTPVDMAPAIELVASGKIDVSVFITARYPLDQVAAAFEEYERNPSRILRIVIDAGGEERRVIEAERAAREASDSLASCANPAAQGPQPCAESARFTGLSMVYRPLTILGL